MRDIARRAGVHPATVSRALRDDPRISAEARARVQQVAAQLDYQKHPFVAALMSARRAGREPGYRATMGFITHYPPERARLFESSFGELLSGARERAAQQGYRLEEFNLHQTDLTGRRASEILLARGIHGLIVAPLHSTTEAVELDWNQFAVVAVGHSLARVPVTRVSHNHFRAYAQAVTACRESGWRRLGLVLPSRVHDKVQKRWVASCLLDQSERPLPENIPPLLLAEHGDEAAFVRWWREHRPEVLLGVHMVAMRGWLKRLGCEVPRDVSLVSLDRHSGRQIYAGIDQDYAGMGATAVDMLNGILLRNERGLPERPVTVLLDGIWRPGRSLRAAR